VLTSRKALLGVLIGVAVSGTAALVFGTGSLAGLRSLIQTREHREPDVIFVATPPAVVKAMLEVARVGPNDLVVDLGSGDGRIVIAAAKEYGARAVGIEIDSQLIAEAQDNARKAGVADRVRFFQEDLFQADIREATVVTLYLLPPVNLKLRPKLLHDLKPGTRVVSHAFHMGDWKPDQVLNVEGRQVYFWVIPPDAK
jgi:ribosomal protein L11 methylase PrmA